MYREYLSNILNIELEKLKDELNLKLILKARLTKKELKILNGELQNSNIELLCEKLNIDSSRYKELKLKIEKKLNRDNFKKEILS